MAPLMEGHTENHVRHKPKEEMRSDYRAGPHTKYHINNE